MAERSSAQAPGADQVGERIGERERVVRELFEGEAARLARACHAMARQFSRGGTLIPFGTGAAATDASHAAVEFMHPVIVGKRALPAISPASDTTRASALSSLARPDDIGLAISHGELDPETASFLAEARRRGMLTIAMTGAGAAAGDAEHAFAVPSEGTVIGQENPETQHHLHWEVRPW